MNAIELDLASDDQVLAVYYGGSIGNQNMDTYSDIDLRVVVEDEAFEQHRLNKKQRTEKLGQSLILRG